MSVTKVGFVRYSDDPDKRYFRKVIPTVDDAELDDPRWTTERVDNERAAVMDKFAIDSVEATAALNGTP